MDYVEEGLIYSEESYVIQGAIYEVYKHFGCGLLESVYHEALTIELSLRNIPFQTQKEIALSYKNIALNQKFKTDIICFDKIIIELKSVKSLEPIHYAQLLNYMRLTNIKLGLLVNFNSLKKVQIERIVL